MKINELVAILQQLKDGQSVYQIFGDGKKRVIISTPQNIQRIIEIINHNGTLPKIWFELSDECGDSDEGYNVENTKY